MLKVEIQDLESITKFLDKISRISSTSSSISVVKDSKYAAHLSKMIKDKYTEIKPHYDRID